MAPLVVSTFGKMGPSAQGFLLSLAESFTGVVDRCLWLRLAQQYLSCAVVRGHGIFTMVLYVGRGTDMSNALHVLETFKIPSSRRSPLRNFHVDGDWLISNWQRANLVTNLEVSELCLVWYEAQIQRSRAVWQFSCITLVVHMQCGCSRIESSISKVCAENVARVGHFFSTMPAFRCDAWCNLRGHQVRSTRDIKRFLPTALLSVL